MLSVVAAVDAADPLPGWSEAPYLVLGVRVVGAPWLIAGLVAAALPLLVLLVGGGPRRRPLLALVGYTAAAAVAPAPAACALALPAWAALPARRLPRVMGVALAGLSLLPGAYCLAVLGWSLFRFGTAMRVIAPAGFLAGFIVFGVAWLALVVRDG